MGKLDIYLNSDTDAPFQSEMDIIIIVFLIILIILFAHLIIRWLRIYSQGKTKEPKPNEPEIKLKKIPTPKFKLMVGGAYLVLERTEQDEGQGLKIFRDSMRSGSPGLLITRTYPDKVLKKFKLGKIPVLWLSRSKNKNSISPTNLGAIVEELKEFANQNDESIIMFDGLEYLTVHNDFDRVLKFIHSLEDEIAMHKSRLIVSLNPTTLPNKKVAMISKEMRILNIDQKTGSTKQKKSK